MNNIVDFQIIEINNTNLLIKKLCSKIAKMLIIDVKAENKDILSD